MSASTKLFQRYIWLVDTIYSAGEIARDSSSRLLMILSRNSASMAPTWKCWSRSTSAKISNKNRLTLAECTGIKFVNK